MRKYFIIALLLSLITGCAIFHSANVPVSYHRTLIGPEFERFDMSIIEKMRHKVQPNKPKSATMAWDTTFLKAGNAEDLEIYDSQNRLVKDITFFVNGHAYSDDYMSDSSRIYKEYYPNGNIESKAVLTWFDFKIGFDYQFNENGKLVKITDNDKGYRFNADSLHSFFRRNGIVFSRKSPFQNVSKKKIKGKYVWIVQAFVEGKQDLFMFVIYGDTGKIWSVFPIKHGDE